LNFTSDGGYYFQHFYITRNISYSYQYSWSILREVLISPPSYIVFPLLFLGVYQIFKRLLLIKGAKQHERNFTAVFSGAVKSPVILLIGYFILSFALSFFTVARSGASINYYLEFVLVTAIVFGIALSSLKSVMVKRKLYLALTGALVLFSFVRIISLYRGEYYRWESLGYYQEIHATLEKSTPADGVVISVYPDLPALANRDFHFSEWMQYSDGRSPELTEILNEALKSNRYAAVVWQDLYVENLSPHCRLVLMKSPVPVKFYAVYLYVCDARQNEP
jgi:hypothetical protein